MLIKRTYYIEKEKAPIVTVILEALPTVKPTLSLKMTVA
jgi:hypothetical protein